MNVAHIYIQSTAALFISRPVPHKAALALACRVRSHRDAATKRACRVLAARTGTAAAIQQRKSRRDRAHAGTSGMWNGNGIWRCAAFKITPSHVTPACEAAAAPHRWRRRVLAVASAARCKEETVRKKGTVYCGSKRAAKASAGGRREERGSRHASAHAAKEWGW